MLEADIWSQRQRTKIEGFGKPLDIDLVGGGSIDWFECKGMPLEQWDKPCNWYTSNSDHSPVYMAPYKSMFSFHQEEGAGVFG